MRVQPQRGRLGRYVPWIQLRMLEGNGTRLTSVDGTVVFADISGFTRLTERMTRQGHEGSERLVEILDSCFSTLLADAYAEGGSLLKFGGDALLLWFEGAEHAERACSAAVAMRATLRRIGQVRAGLSTIVLRMSVGVHSGTYHFFLAGQSHRELLLAGPAVTTLVAMEAAASSGQILVSHATAARLPVRCLGTDLGLGSLLVRSPEPTDSWGEQLRELGEAAEVRTPDELVAACFSEPLRRHVLDHDAPPEHRTAVVAFLQFGGFDGLVQEHGVEAAADRLEQLVTRVQAAAQRYEVCFLSSDVAQDGGKILLSAGAPRSYGDDEERMVLALREVIDGEPPLPVSIGVNRGHVFAAELGPSYRRVYAAMGDIVNVAARLMARAPDGHIYAAPAVLDRLRTSFRLTPLEPLALKGKQRPLTAWDIGPVISATAMRAARRRPPLIGREQELSVIRTAIEEAGSGAGTLLEIVGETGSGKSRLLTEARRLAAGMRLVHTTCAAYTRETPYSGAGDALRQLLGLRADVTDAAVLARLRMEVRRRDPALEPWLPLLAIAFGLSAPLTREIEQLAPHVRQRKLQQTVFAFFGPELRQPTVIQIEHAHFIDAASADLVNALAKELYATHWLVLVTRQERPGAFVCEPLHPIIELGPLSAEQTMQLARAMPEAERIPPHVLELAVERSAGSPEFLLDLLAAAAEGKREELPDSISAAAAARLDALGPRDRLLVRRASVLGMTFVSDRLSEVLMDELPPPDAAQWARLDPVFARDPSGEIRFKRPAVQEAAYASLPFKTRRRLHAAVARALELESDGADPALLARHWTYAGEPERAYHYGVRAAQRARERFSHADAAGLYRRAVEAGNAAGLAAEATGRRDLAGAWEEYGDSLRCIGEPVPAARAFSEARRLHEGNPVAQARLCQCHAEVAQRVESLPAAVRWVNRGLRLLEDQHDPAARAVRARLRSYLAGLRARQGRWAEAKRACLETIAEAEHIGETRSLAFACYVLDWALVELGRSTEATYSERALEIYRNLGDAEHEATVLHNLGMFSHFDGRWDDAVVLYERAAERSLIAGRAADAAYADCNIGEIRSDQGRFAEARAHLTEARRVWSGSGEVQTLAFVNALLGRLALREGRGVEAVALIREAAEDMRALGMSEAGFAQALLAEAEAITGDPRRALAIAEIELPQARRWLPLLQRAIAIASLRLGRRAGAEAAMDASLLTAREQGSDYDIAAAIDLLEKHVGVSADLAVERDAIRARLGIAAGPARLRQVVA